MYALVRAMGLSLVRSYYRVEVLGRAPEDGGALIVVANHANGLVDGGMLFEATDRPLRVLVKASLLRMPVFKWMFRIIGAIPVYRKKDGADTKQNEASFAAISSALERGEPIAVFPEGTSSHLPELGRFKTGAARMALEAEQRAGFRLGLRILPLGVVYEEMRRFRSRAVTIIGEPFGIAHWQARYELDEWAAVQGLTAEIEQAIRALAETGASFEEVHERIDAETLAESDGRSRHERWRALAEIQAQRKQAGAQPLTGLGKLRGAIASLQLSPSEALRLSQMRGTLLSWLLWTPVVLLGALIWAPPVLLARGLARFAPLPVDKYVTTILLAAWLLCPLWVLTLVLFTGRWLGWPAGLAAGLLAPLLGRLARDGWRGLRAPPFLVSARLGEPLEQASIEAEELVRGVLGGSETQTR